MLYVYEFQAFLLDDFELQVIQKGYYPFCRISEDELIGI